MSRMPLLGVRFYWRGKGDGRKGRMRAYRGEEESKGRSVSEKAERRQRKDKKR